MAAKKASFNKGHIAEYIFAIAVGAVFYGKSANKQKILDNYKILKNVLQKNFNDLRGQSQISFQNVESPTLKVFIKLGDKAPSRLALESLRYFFENEDEKGIKDIEQSALNFAINFAEENKKSIEKNTKLIEVSSEGIVDQLSSKADITLKVDGVVRNFSLKTKSSTVHATSWNSARAIEMLETLFSADLKKVKFPKNKDDKEAQRTFLASVCKVVSDSSGKIKNKKGFITGLRKLITKQDQKIGFDTFELVKLEGPEKYTTLLFSNDYVNMAEFFDYDVITEAVQNPKIKVVLKLPTREAFRNKFVAARPQDKKFLLEVGPVINLMANKYLKTFLSEFDSNEKLSENGKRAIYSQLRTTFNTVGFTENDVLTDKGRFFVYGAKKTLGIS